MSTVKARAIHLRADPMNGLERRYAVQLQILQAAGEILEWGYERIKLKIGEGAWYTPDFDIVEKDGSVTFAETKGFMREAANVRIKSAALQYPRYKFQLVRWENGGWNIKTI